MATTRFQDRSPRFSTGSHGDSPAPRAWRKIRNAVVAAAVAVSGIVGLGSAAPEAARADTAPLEPSQGGKVACGVAPTIGFIVDQSANVYTDGNNHTETALRTAFHDLVLNTLSGKKEKVQIISFGSELHHDTTGAVDMTNLTAVNALSQIFDGKNAQWSKGRGDAWWRVGLSAYDPTPRPDVIIFITTAMPDSGDNITALQQHVNDLQTTSRVIAIGVPSDLGSGDLNVTQTHLDTVFGDDTSKYMTDAAGISGLLANIMSQVQASYECHLTIEKVLQPKDQTMLSGWDFNVNYKAGPSVSGTTDSTGTVMHNNSSILPLADLNTYQNSLPVTVKETPRDQTGYLLQSVTCSDGTTSFSPETSDNSFTISQAELVNVYSGSTVAGTTVTCTVTNSKWVKLQVVKDVVNNDGGPDAKANDWSFSVEGTDDPVQWSGTTGASSHGVTAWMSVMPGAPVVVTESGGVLGYALTDASCQVVKGGGWPQGEDPTWTGSQVSFTVPTDLGAGAEIVCTFENTYQPPLVHVVKQVGPADAAVKATAGEWSFALSGQPFEWLSGADSLLGTTKSLPVEPGDDVTVAESDGVAGYALTSASCGVADETVDLAAGTVSFKVPPGLAAGAEIVCTFENTYVTPQLTLAKTVYGPFLASVWTLQADPGGADPILKWGGTGNPVQDTRQDAKPGAVYVLSEISTTSGAEFYTQDDHWICQDVNGRDDRFRQFITVAGEDAVTLYEGSNVRCEVTNAIAVVDFEKEVVNDDTGGTATPDEFSVTLSDAYGSRTTPIQEDANGVFHTGSITVKPNTQYTVTETPADLANGYTMTIGDCVGADVEIDNTAHTIALPVTPPLTRNEDVPVITCTVTNTAQAPTLTLEKKWPGAADDTKVLLTAQEYGQDAVIGEPPVTLTAGTSTITTATVVAGTTYDLAESVTLGSPSAQVGGWVCVDSKGGTVEMSASIANGILDQVTPKLGQNITCTATNATAHVILEKTVLNDHGGKSTPDQWELTLTPTTPGASQPQDLLGLSVTNTDSDPVRTNTGTTQSGTTGEVSLEPGQTYALTEVYKAAQTDPGMTPSDAGYQQGLVVCHVGASTDDVNQADQNNLGPAIQITPETARDAALANTPITCQFVNQDQAAQLTLVKKVNGPAGEKNWTLAATPQTDDATLQPISGKTGDAAVTGAEVAPNVGYELTEDPTERDTYVPLGDWSCDGAADTYTFTGAAGNQPAQVSLKLGAHVTCTITNAIAAVQFDKKVDNPQNSGGRATPTNFQIRLTDPAGNEVTKAFNAPVGAAPATTDEILVKPHTEYTITEVPADLAQGYAMTVVCDVDGQPVDMGNTLNLAPSETDPEMIVACHVTNTAKAPTLTLKKDWPGHEVAADGVTLTATPTGPDATGLDALTGTMGADKNAASPSDRTITDQSVTAGVPYALTETVDPSLAGASLGWACVDNNGQPLSLGQTTVNGVATPTVTPKLGQDVTCTLTNVTANVIIEKTVINDHGGTAEPVAWSFTLTPDEPGLPTLADRIVTSQDAVPTGDRRSGTTDALGLKPGVKYDVAETRVAGAGPTGYLPDESITCTLPGYPSDDINLARNAMAIQIPLPLPQVAAGSDTTITCHVTNRDQAAELTLDKQVVGGHVDKTAWNLTATPGLGNALTWLGDQAATKRQGVAQEVLPGVVYALDEQSRADAAAAYAPQGWTCSGSDGQPLTPVAALTDDPTAESAVTTDGHVRVALGDHVACALTNATVDVVIGKTVNNDHGGTAAPNNWQFTLTPPQGSGLPPVENLAVNAPGGTATITHTGTTWSGQTNPTTLKPGVTYTLEEWWKPRNGGALKSPEDVGYRMGSTVSCQIEGTGGEVNMADQADGPAIMIEPAAAQQAAHAGRPIVCHVTNTDQAATLTLKKVANGTAHAATDWTLIAATDQLHAKGPLTGPTGSAGVTDVEVTPGVPYQLSENPATLGTYVQFGPWACAPDDPNAPTTDHYTFTDAADGNPAQVTLQQGAHVTCTITNATASAQFDKIVDNSHGGTAQPSDFAIRLTAEGVAPITAPITGGAHGAPASTGPVDIRPGTAYTISEVAGPNASPNVDINGYAMTVQCDVNGDGQLEDIADNTINVPASAHPTTLTCQVTNTAKAATLTLKKDWPGYPHDAARVNLSATPNDRNQPHLATIAGNMQWHTDAITGQVVEANVPYTLAESFIDGAPASTPLGWTCVDNNAKDAHGQPQPQTLHLDPADVITPQLGQAITCTVINISAKVMIEKTVKNDLGGTSQPRDWQFTLTPTGDDPLPAALTDLAVHNSGDPQRTHTGTTQDGLTEQVALQPGVTYTVEEWNIATGQRLTPADAAYQADQSIACYVGDDDTNVNQSHGLAIQIDADTAQQAAVDHASIICHVVNHDLPAHLTLVKVVYGGAGAVDASHWTLSATNPHAPITEISGATGTHRVTGAEASAGVPYALSENPSTLGTYVPLGWSCGAAKGTFDFFAGNQYHPATVTLAQGADVTCTLTNTTAAVKFDKTVVNDHGGTASPADFVITLTGEGVDPVSVPINHDGTTDKVFIKPDTAYTISESTAPGATPHLVDAYTMTVNCEGVDTPHNTITLPASPDAEVVPATCHVTNTYKPVTLTLAKEVVGGPATAGAWALTVAPPALGVHDVTVGQLPITQNADHPVLGQTDSVWVVPGQTYTIAEVASGEVAVSGYALTGVRCTVGDDPNPVTWASLAHDGALRLEVPADISRNVAIACTLINTNQAAQLSVTKHVVGGPATASAWIVTLDPSAVGPNGQPQHALRITESADHADTGSAGPVWVMPGQTYTLAEMTADGTSVPNYSLTAATCKVGVHSVEATILHGKVQVKVPALTPAGAQLTCDLTNTYQTVELSIAKHVAGGPAGAGAWSLTLDPAAASQHGAPLTQLNIAENPTLRLVGQADLAWLVPGQTYTLSEVTSGDAGTGYTLTSANCSVAGVSVEWATVVHGALHLEVPADLGSDHHIACTLTNTYTNQPVQVVVTKHVEGGSATASAWQLAVHPQAVDAHGASLQDLPITELANHPDTGTAAPVWLTPGQEYTLSEVATGHGSVDGYAPSAVACTVGDHHAVAATLVDGVVHLTVPEGTGADAVVACELTNKYTQPMAHAVPLTVTKHVVGGSTTASAWTVTLDPQGLGPDGQPRHALPIVELANHPDTGTAGPVSVTPGQTYTLSELAADGGSVPHYALTAATCTLGAHSVQATIADGKVQVAVPAEVLAGTQLTCELTNTYAGTDKQPVQVNLTKHVVGGSATASAWQLAVHPQGVDAHGAPLQDLPITELANHPDTGRAASVWLVPGQEYTLSEVATGHGSVDGYAPSAIMCTVGDHHAVAATLVDGVVHLTVPEGTGPDAVVTCDLTNAHTMTAQLTLNKTVASGPLTAADWMLTAQQGGGRLLAWLGHPQATHHQGVAQQVEPGLVYTLNELSVATGQADYVSEGWSCSRLDPVSGTWIAMTPSTQPLADHPAGASNFTTDGHVQVAAGDQVACSVTNTTATVELTKVVQNDAGGTADAAAWRLALMPTTATEAAWHSLTPATGATASSGTFTVRPGAAYTLREDAAVGQDEATRGYAVVGMSCTASNGAVPPTVTKADDSVVAPQGDTVAVADGDTVVFAANANPDAVVTCTITNGDTAPTLTLHKAWPGAPDGATVDLTATPQPDSPQAHVVTGNVTIKAGEGVTTPLELVGGVGYHLAEHVTSETPYTAVGSWSCTVIDRDGHKVPLASPDDQITPSVGQQIDCTQTNVTAKVQFDKTVVNDDGGQAAPDSWSISLEPVDTKNHPIPGAQPVEVGVPTRSDATHGTTQPAFVQAGQRYKVVETGTPGYTGSKVQCSVTVGGVTFDLRNQTDEPLFFDVPAPDTRLSPMLFDNVISCAITNDDPSVPLVTLGKNWPGGDLGLIPTNMLTTELTATPVPPALVDDGFTTTPYETLTLGAAAGHRLTLGQTYTLTEKTPDGVPYAADGWTCVDAEGNKLPTPDTPGIGSGSVYDPDANKLIIGVGTAIRCTALNRTADLSLKKVVSSGPGQPTDWTLTLTPSGPPPPAGSAAVLTQTTAPGEGVVQLVPGATYTVSETLVGQLPPDYSPIGHYPVMGKLSCDGDSVTVSGNTLTVKADAKDPIGPCWVTNTYVIDDVPVDLDLTKVVDGGPTKVGDWEITLTPDDRSAALTVRGTGKVPVKNDVTYTVTERAVGVPSAGYAAMGKLACDAPAVVSKSGTATTVKVEGAAVPPGIKLTLPCTLTNTYTEAQVSLAKMVDGGPTKPGDWVITLTPADGSAVKTVTGSGTVTLKADVSYTVAERTVEGVSSAGYPAMGTLVCAAPAVVSQSGGVTTLMVPAATKPPQDASIACSLTNTYPTPPTTTPPTTTPPTTPPVEPKKPLPGSLSTTGATASQNQAVGGTWLVAMGLIAIGVGLFRRDRRQADS